MIYCENINQFIEKFLEDKDIYQLSFKDRNLYKELIEYCENNNNAELYPILGILYQSRFVTKDLEKSRIYLEKSVKANTEINYVYYELANIYYDKNEIDKAYPLYVIATEKNHMIAPYFLGEIKEKENDITSAIKYYEIGANRGHWTCNYKLAKYYQEGKYYEQNTLKYYYHLAKAGLNNYSPVFDELGITKGEKINEFSEMIISAIENDDDKKYSTIGYQYIAGEYLNKDYEKAFFWLNLAYKKGDLAATNNLGYLYHKGLGCEKDLDKAEQYYLISANKNNTRAKINLSNLYTEKNEKELAISWLKKIALENTKACYNLAYTYYVDEVFDEAIKYFKIAAQNNVVDAYLALGNIYSNSKHPNQDIFLTSYYYAKSYIIGNRNTSSYFKTTSNCNFKDLCTTIINAIENNDTKSQHLIGTYYFNGKILEKNYSTALKWFHKSFDNNNLSSCFHIAYSYAQGLGTKVDIDKAIEYYLLIAENDPGAAHNVSLLYINNKNDINNAIYWLEKAANLNYIKSILKLGLLYKDEKQTIYNPKKALFWLSKGYELNDAHCCFYLGELYFNGNIKKNLYIAFEYFNRSVELNETFAAYVGYRYELINDYDNALILYLKGAKINDINSMIYLARLYNNENFKDYDITKAIYWYKQIVDKGNNKYLYTLGQLYYANGQYEEAINTYLKGAEIKDEYSLFALGSLYYEGNIVDLDYEKSRFYLEQASNLGNINAKYLLVNLYLVGIFKVEIDVIIKLLTEIAYSPDANIELTNTEESLSYGQDIMRRLVNDASIQDEDVLSGINETMNEYSTLKMYRKFKLSTIAFMQLGSIYYDGAYVKQDLSKAFEYFSIAAINDEPISQFYLAIMYDAGFGIEQNNEKAIYWYEKSATNGYSHAQNNLGIIYEEGIITEENMEKAMYWYEQAANNNNTYACANLGGIYHYNNEYELALKYYKKALDFGYEAVRDAYNEVISLLKCEKSSDVLSFSNKLKLGQRLDVFISWNHNDADIKNKLVDDLANLGFNSCWDSDGNGHGELDEVLKEAIDDSKASIILVTENAIKSKWMGKEIEHMLAKASINPIYYQMIKPVLISSENNNITDLINKLDDSNPFKKLLKLGGQFENIENGININNIYKFVTQAIDKTLKVQYKSKLISSLEKFSASLSNSIDTINSNTGIIRSMVSFEKTYIERLIYKDNIGYDTKHILNSKNPTLIYGFGGCGKSLYMKDLIRKGFTDNNYMFLAECGKINSIIETEDNFLNLLKKLSFDVFYSDYSDVISLESFENIFINNKVYLLIDALDEINENNKDKLLNMLMNFKNKYQNISFIFTSRNINDSLLIENKLNYNNVETYELRGFNNNEIEKLYENLASEYQNTNKTNFASMIEMIDDDVRNNPLLLSNLIFIYLSTKDFPNKKYEILNKTVKILINDIEKERNVSFKYKNYLTNNILTELLGDLAIRRSKNNHQDTEIIFKTYLEKKFNNIENLDEVASEIYKYLKRRAIIVDNKLSHELFNEYFVATKIFNDNYIRKEDDDLYVSYFEILDEIKFRRFVKLNLSINNFPWTSIVANLISKLDYEIKMTDIESIMDEYNMNYPAFDSTLKIGITENGFSEKSIEVISDLVERNSLYYAEFIKKYL